MKTGFDNMLVETELDKFSSPFFFHPLSFPIPPFFFHPLSSSIPFLLPSPFFFHPPFVVFFTPYPFPPLPFLVFNSLYFFLLSIENDLRDSFAVIDVQRIKSSTTIVSISQLLSFTFILNENKRRKKSLHSRFSQNIFE